ncbi:hypothetical protein A6A29_29820 [Streptomyces sp. TSRI0281]|nr:hypothetical protein A6A29_29820 [Streptomyces sp. TSRI0281]
MVVIAPQRIGVCRSDLRELRSDRHQRRDFGHEIVADVVAATKGVAVSVGQRVVLDPHPQLHTRTSGFGQLVELSGTPDLLRDALVPVPRTMGVDRAVFTEPLACACHCIERLHTVTDELGMDRQGPVAVVGAGMAGALIAAGLHASHVPVTVVNRGHERLDFLRRREFLPNPVLGGPDGSPLFSRTVLATAYAEPAQIRQALDLLLPGGLLLLFAGTRPGMELAGVDIDDLRRRERLAHVRVDGRPLAIAGTHGALRTDFEHALQLLNRAANGEWRLGPAVERLVTRRMTLAQAARLLPEHADRGFLGKPVVVPTPRRRP